MVDKRVIKAVHDYDLEEFLKSIGLLESIRLGEVACARCGESITIDTLNGVGKFQGELKVFCNRPGCLTMEVKQGLAD